MRRDAAALADGTFDVLVVGGGITGAGVALDAALRGLRVALVDKGDFASGTSSASSKLVHGGLRYLEQGNLRLVYEALHERARLLRNAPHLTWPLRFVLPYYRGARVPPWKWRAGLALYDLLAGRSNIRRSRSLTAGRVRRDVPGLRGDGLTGGGEYFDAQMDDARLCIAVLRSAARGGAVVANYAEVVGFERSGGRLAAATVRDHVGRREFRIVFRQAVLAVGPWADHLRRLAGDEDGPLLRPTKGVHLVASGPGPAAALLLLHPRDGRVFFVLPWLGKTLLGTTDTDTAESPDALTVTADDEAYLLEGYNHYLDPPLSSAGVLGRFAGLRPLLTARAGEPSARSRDFRLVASPSGLLTVAGGKYTTYRRMAEVTTDAVCRRLGIRRRCRTRDFRLDGAPDGPWPEFERTAVTALIARGIAPGAARHLVRRYGTNAYAVADYVLRRDGMARPLIDGEPDLWGELSYQADEEMAVRPEDHLLRRTRVGLFRPETLAGGRHRLPARD